MVSLIMKNLKFVALLLNDKLIPFIEDMEFVGNVTNVEDIWQN